MATAIQPNNGWAPSGFADRPKPGSCALLYAQFAPIAPLSKRQTRRKGKRQSRVGAIRPHLFFGGQVTNPKTGGDNRTARNT